MASRNKSVNLDDPATTEYHREVIQKNRFLKKIYLEWYDILKNNINPEAPGKIVELGSGGGFLKEVLPEVITSDVQKLPGCDMSFTAEKLPFDDNALKAILMVNVFHHIPTPLDFLKEANRCLSQHGRVIMIEPANTTFARFIYQNFHHEDFDPHAGWELKESGKPLSLANGALPWIFFERDHHKVKEILPDLNLISLQHFMPLKYLFSGGFTYRSLLPSSFYGLATLVEKIISPMDRWTSLFQLIVLEKQPESQGL